MVRKMVIRENEYGIIAKTDEVLKLNPNEWRVLSAIPRSNTIARISELTGLPYSTVIDVVKRLVRGGIKVNFVPHYDILGLMPLVLIYKGLKTQELPLYTIKVSKLMGTENYVAVEGLVPERFIDSYISAIPGEPLHVVKGLEIKHWLPTGRLTTYVSGLGLVIPTTEKMEEVLAAGRAPLERRERRWIDWIDLLVIIFKMQYSYTKLSDVSKMIESQLKIEAPSRQLMSYHYRTHVMGLWRYNSVSIKLNTTVAPLRFYYFEGKDARVAARVLTEMPYYFEALVDENVSAVYAQPPCYTHTLMYEILSQLNLEMPLGEVIRVDERELQWITSEAIKHYHDRGDWMDPSQFKHQVAL